MCTVDSIKLAKVKMLISDLLSMLSCSPNEEVIYVFYSFSTLSIYR